MTGPRTTADAYEQTAELARRTRFSRRTLLRGTGLSVLAAGAGPLVMAGRSWAATAPSAAPFGRHLTVGTDPTTQMNVAWQTTVNTPGVNMRLGTSAADLSQVFTPETRTLMTAAAGAAVPDVQYYQHVELSRLAPATTYYYAVGDDVTSSTTSAVNSFTTAPAKAVPFTFTAFGDQGVTSDAVLNDAVILTQKPAFHLHAGDITYADSSGSGSTTDTYTASVWDDWFKQVENVAKSIPWMVASGNHDMEAVYSPNGYGGLEARFTQPTSGAPGCPTTYSFRYGNVAILSLDANDVSNEITANRGYSGGAQTSWLGATLQGYRNDPTIDFIVCYFHHCAYATITSHTSEGGVRDLWSPVFDTWSVDLVVNGHNHCYERTDPIRAGAPTRETPIGSTTNALVDGTTYVCAGAGGQGLYAFNVPDSYEGNVHDVESVVGGYWEASGQVTEKVTWSRVRRTKSSILAMDVVPAATPGGMATMTLRGVDENGVEIDRLTMTRQSASSATPAALPEVASPWFLPVAGLAVAAGVGAWRRTSSGLDVPGAAVS